MDKHLVKNLWQPHFCTFCELVEMEENKLTTFSTWTIMLGCNESNINFPAASLQTWATGSSTHSPCDAVVSQSELYLNAHTIQ